jgi:hypothetical protein
MKMIRSHPPQGYRLQEAAGTRDEKFVHQLGGSHHIRGGVSPNSGRPLLQLARLDTSDVRISLEYPGIRYLPLLFSWTCDISQAPFLYDVLTDTEIKIIKYNCGNAYERFPYANYPDYFLARPASLSPISDEDQFLLRGLNRHRISASKLIKQRPDLCRPQHQIGGEPFLVQPWISLKCPKCARVMPFLASIGDETGATRGLTGNPFVQTLFSVCPICKVIGAFQQCD